MPLCVGTRKQMHLSKLPDTDRFSGTVRALSSPEPVMLHKRAKQTRSQSEP